MTGQINVNKIVARSGNLITYDSADVVNITLAKGEGTASTNLKQGLCKHWSQTDNFDTIDDSFNLSTLTDVGTGQSRLTLTTNMASENNACINDQNYFGANGVGGAEFDNSVTQTTGSTHTTSTVALSSKYTSSNGYLDTHGTGCIFSTVFGDLA